ncbi:hypothetical protein [Mycobacterium sp. NAZ190054]|uniref:hypothetical protein n=1 Tax=Mycobacterium sp. NAZ190054 TaxID=1747766 RepID=UPI0007985B63|nr:hypothetical protein [Mycobacterium sp. NAZ190054]KWX66780.1 hypothetical protein ASJ79_24060 [Mycobacterium sp. NAZ190054]
MTGSDDDHSSTRPISVAELLARNGTIGAPPVGGRRRRRRGNADAVTVAELTGEIPVIRADEPTDAEPEPDPEPEPETDATEKDVTEETTPDDAASDSDDAETDPDDAPDAEDTADEAADDELDDAAEAADDDDVTDEETEVAAPVAPRDAEPEEAPEPTRRFGFGRFGRKSQAVDAEQWTPDPVDDDVPAGAPDEYLTDAPEIEDLDDEIALTPRTDAGDDGDERDGDDELPSYLRSTEAPLFGGHTVDTDTDTDTDQETDTDTADRAAVDGDDLDQDTEPRQMSSFVHGLWIVGQSVIAVIFGAGLFVAFDQLWKWNNIVALVLSVLVILGLVVGVRVVRKTEDIGSTLIAVAVGALVTLGPLALLQSG